MYCNGDTELCTGKKGRYVERCIAFLEGRLFNKMLVNGGKEAYTSAK